MSSTKLVAASQKLVPQQAITQYVTIRVADMWLGIAVEHVSDVIHYQPVTRVPLAPPAIMGIVNLRGRIATVIDTRKCLGLGEVVDVTATMLLVVKHQDEYFALMVDKAEEVLALAKKDQERLPTNIDDHWRSMASGVYTLEKGLLIILNMAHFIDQLSSANSAA